MGDNTNDRVYGEVVEVREVIPNIDKIANISILLGIITFAVSTICTYIIKL